MTGAYRLGAQKTNGMTALIWEPSIFMRCRCDKASDASARKAPARCQRVEGSTSHDWIFGHVPRHSHALFGFDLTVGQLIRVSITFLAAANDIDRVLHESFPRHKKHATGWLLTMAAAYLTMMMVLVFTGVRGATATSSQLDPYGLKLAARPRQDPQNCSNQLQANQR